MRESDKSKPIYRVLFLQNEKQYEIYARYLTEESLMGFIDLEEILFSEGKTGLVVDPTEEKLRMEFKGVKRTYIPLHMILRIDEVSQEGVARISDHKSTISKTSNVSRLPLS